jgi:glycosyltransferase involved in cell wall biosynthesis
MNKICIYAICKNEEKFIDRWFNSIKNADYICVLDTGSTDGTYEKLLQLKNDFPNKLIIEQKIITP